MILLLDTTKFDQLQVVLVGSKVVKKVYDIPHGSENILSCLDRFLGENKTVPKDLKKIVVVVGDGSFTGMRTSVSIALAFNLALGTQVFSLKKKKIPKNLKDIGKLKLTELIADHEPLYSAPPKITKGKKKILKNT